MGNPIVRAFALAALVAGAAFGTSAAAATGNLAYAPVEAAAPQPATGRQLGDPNELAAFLDGVMEAELGARKLVGASISVVKDGEVIFAKGYGFEDLERRMPVDPAKTLFRPGSVSKLFTWTAVMQLVEAGKIDLDADVNRYLTQFQIPEAFDAPVTMRNLLTHSAGFEDRVIGYLFVNSQEKQLPLATALARHVPARVMPPTTDFASGTGVAYSNWGSALAGLIVANVAGLPFEDYVEQNILNPLGMERSTFREPVPEPLAERAAVAYAFKNGAFEAQGFEYISNFAPAGSMSTNAMDMARFMIANLSGGELDGARILKPETLRLMHRRSLSPDPTVNGMALGFYETWINGRRTIGHGGATVYHKTEMMLLPEAGVGLFVTFNAPDGAQAAADVKKAFMDRYFPADLPQIAPPADFASRAGEFAGSYRHLLRSHSTVEAILSVFRDVQVRPMPDNTLLIHGLLDDSQRWVETAPDLFRAADGDDTIAFKRNAEGRVAYLVGPFTVTPLEKISWFETGGFHMVLVGLALLFFVIAIVAMLRNWKRDNAADRNSRLARRNLGLLGLVNILLLFLLVSSFSGDIEDLIYEFPDSLTAALTLSFVTVILTLAALVFAFFVWRDRSFGLWSRIFHTGGVVMAVAFLWFLNHWNFIGYNYG